RFLDKQVGKGEYLVFLSADHGVAQIPAFLREHKIPAGNVNDRLITEDLNAFLKEKFKTDKLVIGLINYQIYLDRKLISDSHLNKEEVDKEAIGFLLNQPGITRAFATESLS